MLWIVAMKLQISLQGSIHWSELVSLYFNLIHHVDAILTQKNEELVNSIRVDKLIWQAGVEFLVANPLALTTCFYKAAKSGFQIFNGKTHGSTPILKRGKKHSKVIRRRWCCGFSSGYISFKSSNC